MLFNELRVGDVFVLRWWIDTSPTWRHYLVVDRNDDTIYVLRLEESDHKLIPVDHTLFDECVRNKDLALALVSRLPSLEPYDG